MKTIISDSFRAAKRSVYLIIILATLGGCITSRKALYSNPSEYSDHSQFPNLFTTSEVRKGQTLTIKVRDGDVYKLVVTRVQDEVLYGTTQKKEEIQIPISDIEEIYIENKLPVLLLAPWALLAAFYYIGAFLTGNI